MKINCKWTAFCCLVAIATLSSCSSSNHSSGKGFVAVMKPKESIQGVCDNSYIIAIVPFAGNNQIDAKAPKSKEEITKEVNAKITFLRDKPDYNDKGMVNLIVNCRGELVQCEIDNKTKSPELDTQIVAVFAEMKSWTPGTVNNQAVDTSVLYSFTIKSGKFILN